MSEIHDTILRVLAGQSPGYLAAPSFSGFLMAGLNDVAATERALAELEADGHIHFQLEQADFDITITETVPATDADGKQLVDAKGAPVTELQTTTETVPIVTDQGWAITDTGQMLVN